jgi:hypothetical protein
MSLRSEVSADWHRPHDHRSLTRRRCDLETPVKGVESVAHVAQTHAVVHRSRIEARAVVTHLEPQLCV